ncbi:MAG: hypothetical protein HY475_03420 [Candidatus Terrybacteria bacterium]|nr:hypothetical protein [Candidatus Terrybacteria bacterium]
MLTAYLTWHYGRGFRSAFSIAANFLLFAVHLFSIRELASTLFLPWRQMTFAHRGGWLTAATFSALWGNLLSRILGACARMLFIALGGIFIVFVGIGVAIFLGGWLLGPLVPPLFFFLGVALL